MSRRLSTEHLEAYRNGVFKNLLNVIKEDPDLSFEIRKDNEAMVYYKKDKILTTRYKSESSYTIKMLSEKYYGDMEQLSVNLERDPTALNSIDSIETYFQEAKEWADVKNIGAEFTIQQNIASGNHSFEHRFLVVDMEWAFSQYALPTEERIDATRIDLVIVDTKLNAINKNDVYLAELKVGTNATKGDSGIIPHVDKTLTLIDKKEARVALLEDVKCIIEQKEFLGLIGGNHKKLDLDEIPKMMILAYSRGGKERKILKKVCCEAMNFAFEKYHTQPMLIEIDGRITL